MAWIQCCCSCGIGWQLLSDLPLAWDPLCALDMSVKRKKTKDNCRMDEHKTPGKVRISRTTNPIIVTTVQDKRNLEKQGGSVQRHLRPIRVQVGRIQVI